MKNEIPIRNKVLVYQNGANQRALNRKGDSAN